MFLRVRRVALACLALAGLLALPLAAGAQGSAVYFITNEAAVEFPQVTFDFRAVDLANQTIPNLSSVNLVVYENGLLVPEVQITPRTDGPIHYLFVIDLGRQSNYPQVFGLNNIRTAITTLVTTDNFVDGKDTVQVLGRQNINSDLTETLLASTSVGADLVSWASNFNFQRGNGPTKGLLAVEDAVAIPAEEGRFPGAQTAVVIFITRFIEEPRDATPSAESAAQLARGQFVSTYVFHTDTGRRGPQPLETLAAGGNGQYVHLLRASVATQAGDIYRAINGQRTRYSAVYRSQLGASGPRVITINTAERPTAGRAGEYSVVVQPPSIAIVAPVAGTTLPRNPVLDAGGLPVLGPDGLPEYSNEPAPVRAAVTWPSGIPARLLEEAELLVDGEQKATVRPAPGAVELTFEWDISDVVTTGSHQLEVRVTDELDVKAVSPPVPINIQIVALPPTPVPDPMDVWRERLTGSTNALWVIAPLAALGLLLAFVISAVVLFLTRPEQARKVVSDVRNTLLGGGPRGKQRILATLKVLDGPMSWVGETINISKDKTTLGRNPQTVDIPFYRDEESSISRVHCTIQMDRSAFLLTDHGSTSGTRVNGEWLKPNDPVQLRDGDEIVMGDLTQRGVKLRFNYLPDKTEPPASVQDRTRLPEKVEKSAEKTMWDGFKWDEDKWNEDQ